MNEAPGNMHTTSRHVEPSQKKVKEEVPDVEMPGSAENKTEPITEPFTSEQDSLLLKIYEELLTFKKQSFQLEHRIQKVEKRPAEVDDTLKSAEETIQATCHYLEEQAEIIKEQAQKIKKFDERFAEIERKNEEVLKNLTDEIHKSGKIQNSDSKKVQSQINKFAEALNSKSGGKDVQGQLNKIVELLGPSSLAEALQKFSENQYEELKKIRNQLDKCLETEPDLKKIQEQLNNLEATQKTNTEALKEYAKIQHNENKILKNQLNKFGELLDKTSKNHERELESLKEEIQKVKNDEIEKTMDDKFSKFLEDVKNQMEKKSDDALFRRPNIIPPREQRKRSAGFSTSESPTRKHLVIVKPECIFCDELGHDSIKCTRFPSSRQRQLKLEEKNMCTKCLAITQDYNQHDSCPREDNECPNCVDKYPGNKYMTNHHAVVCESNALPFDPSNNITLPQRNTEQVQCIFCDAVSHDSVDCTRFSSFVGRRDYLSDKDICIRCLQPRFIDKGNYVHEKHLCSKVNEPCPNCVDVWPGRKYLTHHHLLLCSFIPSPKESNEEEPPRHCHQYD